MSVSIANMLAKPAARSASNNATASEPTAVGQDFSSLLLGQMTAEELLKSDALRDSGLTKERESTTGEAAPQDASLLLASLGIALPLPVSVDAASKDLTLEAQLAANFTLNDSLQSGRKSPISADPATAQPANDSGKAAIFAGSGIGDANLDLHPEGDQLANIRTAGSASADGDVSAKSGAEPGLLNSLGSKHGLLGATTPAVTAAFSDRLASDAIVTKVLDSAFSETSSSATHTHSGLHGTGNISTNAPVPLKVETPLHSQAWAEDFSQKVVWMASSDKQTAQITINPPDMGPIEISLNLTKDNASAFFVSQSAEVRTTIETALPRLKEMLAGVGIELGQSNVSSQTSQQQQGNQGARHGSPRWMADNAILGADSVGKLTVQTATALSGNGLVDLFA